MAKPNPSGKSSGSKSSRPRTPRGAVMRRPPTEGLPLLRYRARLAWVAALDKPGWWIGLFALVGTWILLPQRSLLEGRLDEGAIASRTWVAERDLQVVDEEATRALQQRAAQEVLPVYDRDDGRDRRLRLIQFFTAGRALFENGELDDLIYKERAPKVQAPRSSGDGGETRPARVYADDVLQRLAEASELKVDREQLELLVANGFSQSLEDRLAGLMLRIFRQGVVADKTLLLEHRVRGITVRDLLTQAETKELDLFRYLDYPEQVREEVDDDIRTWVGWSQNERRILGDLSANNLSPNLNFNNNETLLRREAAKETVGSVTHTFGQGEVIVRRGARLDALGARALRLQRGEHDQGLGGFVLSVFGIVSLLGAVVGLIWLALGAERFADRSRGRLLSESLLILTLSLLGASLAGLFAGALAGAFDAEPFNSPFSYSLAAPYAAPALVAVLLYGRNIALVLSLCFALLVGQTAASDSQWIVVVYALASSFGAIFALDKTLFRQRSMMTRAAWVVGGVNALGVLTLTTMGGRVEGGIALLGFQVLCGFIGGLLSAAVTSFVVPIFESILQLTTSIKLVELANPNLPLLRRLAFEAPGTFQHSLAVANLAKAGVEAVDGDSVLIHTAALYHDIGKLIRPNYFIENQQAGSNPHDKVQPSMSALILINHVKEGLELAEKYALPSPILDSIEQHHGTRLIKYFYSRAKERCDPDTDEIREDEFRYPGPKPQSKEMGVLMLADAVEAASRTLVEPSTQKIRTVLRAVFGDCLNDGQLDQTNLTLGDLKKVEEAFQRVLSNIYHRRIEYPGFDFNKGNRPKTEESRTNLPRPATGTAEDKDGTGSSESKRMRSASAAKSGEPKGENSAKITTA